MPANLRKPLGRGLCSRSDEREIDEASSEASIKLIGALNGRAAGIDAHECRVQPHLLGHAKRAYWNVSARSDQSG